MIIPLLPELILDLADEDAGLFDVTGGDYRSDAPPPFWSFAWPGGMALGRFVLDQPLYVAGRSVMDLGAGSGLVGIAAARAGACTVTAVDTDPAALAACARNARANGVDIVTSSVPVTAEVILAGDVFYSDPVAERVLGFLRRSGAEVLVGDPGRGYLPTRLFEALATYEVPVRVKLEDQCTMRTTIWRLR
jgi:predicted nicotinamide N-methyase